MSCVSGVSAGVGEQLLSGVSVGGLSSNDGHLHFTSAPTTQPQQLHLSMHHHQAVQVMLVCLGVLLLGPSLLPHTLVLDYTFTVLSFLPYTLPTQSFLSLFSFPLFP